MPMPLSQWLLLTLLAVLWGSAFFFNGIILTELSPTMLVLGRLLPAAIVLVPVVIAMRLPWPKGIQGWMPFAVMSVLNNIVPFLLIARGQQEIASSLASVLNATTPVFSVVLAHLLIGGETITARRLAGIVLGIAGVAILVGPEIASGRANTALGMALLLGAAASYACSGVWGQTFVKAPPVLSSCCQLICSSLVMLVVVMLVDSPWRLPVPGARVMWAIAGLSLLSTALSYIVFYHILAVSGATNVMLTTLLMPVVAVLLGTLVLGETMLLRYGAGALVIACALLTIDGRTGGWIGRALGLRVQRR